MIATITDTVPTVNGRHDVVAIHGVIHAATRVTIQSVQWYTALTR
ncbi:MAG: hypothetical protein ABI382_05530 [Nakamurella sp.]